MGFLYELILPEFRQLRLRYTSRGHGCGIYRELIFVDGKALKWAHSWLRNHFRNAAYRQKRLVETRNRGRAKYSKLFEIKHEITGIA